MSGPPDPVRRAERVKYAAPLTQPMSQPRDAGVRGVPETRKALEDELRAKDHARERLISASRDIIRSSSSAIAAMVRGEDPARHLDRARGIWGSARPVAQEHQDMAATGPLDNALQELAEAEILHAIVRDRPLPNPRGLRVPAAAYVNGLADCIGELRRLALNSLAQGRTDLARHRLAQMEALDHLLSQMHFPSGVAQVKRKQDVARGLIERTRGEVVLGTLIARKDATPDQLRQALARSPKPEDRKGGRPGRRRGRRRGRRGTRGIAPGAHRAAPGQGPQQHQGHRR